MESSFVRLPPSLEDALRPVVDKEQEDRGPVTGLDDLFRVKGLDKCCSGLSIEELQLEMDGFITIEKYKTRVQNSIDYSSREEDRAVLRPTGRGYYYFEMRDKLDRERDRERKKDMCHDWRIAAFTAFVGVLGTVVGFVLGKAL